MLEEVDAQDDVCTGTLDCPCVKVAANGLLPKSDADEVKETGSENTERGPTFTLPKGDAECAELPKNDAGFGIEEKPDD